jgi:citrate synthase
VLATYQRFRDGKAYLEPRTDLSHGANFLYLLRGEEPSPEEGQMFDTCLVLHAEHGFNASTFTARVVASTYSTCYCSISAAIGSLAGFLHGGANERVMDMVDEIGSADNIEPWLDKVLSEKGKVMGMGHRVYKVRDPRAAPLMANLEKMVDATGERQWFDIARTLEKTASKDPYFRDRNLSANVDFYSAPLLYSLGIPVNSFTCMFAMSRIAGWTAQVYEQQANNRLIRPLANFTGKHQRQYVPIGERV